MRLAAVALCLLADSQSVWATPPDRSPRPEPRSLGVILASASMPLPLPSSIVPRPRPDNLRLQTALLKKHDQRTKPQQPEPEHDTGRKRGLCGVVAIKGEAIRPVKAKLRGCGLTDGVMVTSVSGVSLSTPAKIDCTTAKALNKWVEGAVKPSVGTLGGGVAKLQIAASYSCRSRNGQNGTKVSEHGKGRAVDVSGLILQDGTFISVLEGWGSGKEGKILKKIRKTACGPFSTVLGPGSDRFHRDHFHFDTARGRGRYCR